MNKNLNNWAMVTRVIAIVLGVIIFSIICLNISIRTRAQDSTNCNCQLSLIPQDSNITTKGVIDSIKVVRDQFISQKENLKDKVLVLQEKQRKIIETQHWIDSFTMATVIPCVIIN